MRLSCIVGLPRHCRIFDFERTSDLKARLILLLLLLVLMSFAATSGVARASAISDAGAASAVLSPPSANSPSIALAIGDQTAGFSDGNQIVNDQATGFSDGNQAVDHQATGFSDGN